MILYSDLEKAIKMKKKLIFIMLISLALMLSSCKVYYTKAETISVTKAPQEDSVTVSLNKVTIEMTEEGFSPKTLNIKAGDTVVFHNSDTVNHWPASAVHPTHEILPEFDALGPIKHGDSYEFTFSQKGEWKYHDHLNPTLWGVVVAS